MAAFAEPRFSPDGIPSSIHTEVAILGAMLLDAVAISDATARLRADDFSLDSHQRIYRVILDLLAVNHAVNTLMRIEREIIRPQPSGRIADRYGIEQHRAKNGNLGVNR